MSFTRFIPDLFPKLLGLVNMYKKVENKAHLKWGAQPGFDVREKYQATVQSLVHDYKEPMKKNNEHNDKAKTINT